VISVWSAAWLFYADHVAAEYDKCCCCQIDNMYQFHSNHPYKDKKGAILPIYNNITQINKNVNVIEVLNKFKNCFCTFSIKKSHLLISVDNTLCE